jgi:hypothetical protein
MLLFFEFNTKIGQNISLFLIGLSTGLPISNIFSRNAGAQAKKHAVFALIV